MEFYTTGKSVGPLYTASYQTVWCQPVMTGIAIPHTNHTLFSNVLPPPEF